MSSPSGYGSYIATLAQIIDNSTTEKAKADRESVKHEASVGHELLGGAAAFGAFELWEKEQRADGKPVSHSKAKAALAGLIDVEMDRLVEGKGADFVDRKKAEEHANKTAEEMYDQHYGDKEEWHPYVYDPADENRCKPELIFYSSDHAPPAEFDL